MQIRCSDETVQMRTVCVSGGDYEIASGKMPHEVIFPIEFLSLFQYNIAPFALQPVLFVENMK